MPKTNCKLKKNKNKFICRIKNKSKNGRNPFKMIGPWIGAVVYTLPYILAINNIGCSDWGCLVYAIPYYPLLIFQFLGKGLLFLIPITGFLIGWGIQILIRKIRKK